MIEFLIASGADDSVANNEGELHSKRVEFSTVPLLGKVPHKMSKNGELKPAEK